jgi:hypothetical protein
MLMLTELKMVLSVWITLNATNLKQGGSVSVAGLSE